VPAPAIIGTTASSDFGPGYEAGNATDRDFDTYWIANATTGWLRAQVGTGYAATDYRVRAGGATGADNMAPNSWTFQGSNDGSSWTTLDTQTGETGWVGTGNGETRTYSFSNVTTYTFFRLNVTANNGDPDFVAVSELYLDDGAAPTADVEVEVSAAVTIAPLSVEIGGATGAEDVVTVDVDAGVDVTPYVLLRPVAPPAGVLTQWPIERQAHIMPALSEANPRYRPHVDYTVDFEETGRLHVFVRGEDVTYKDGCPAFFDDWSSSVPMLSETARIALPQMKPWHDPGSAPWEMFAEDSSVEIALVRPDDTVDHLWEGFLSIEGDTSGQATEDYLFTADGLFAQAAHELWDPPIIMDPTDYGHLIADVLNSVTHRRWGKIPRFTTGQTTQFRGEMGETKWQYVQDLLARCFHPDHRQLTLARVAPYTYRIQWKKAIDAEPDWTVTKGAHGVAVRLERNHASRVDAIYGRGYAPDGGFWCGRVFPGLDSGVPPVYPMAGFANITVGTTDADTTTGNGVTTWQRQMVENGYPVVIDGVMNANDTQWVEKIQRDSGSTVDGSLGPQTWAATWENNKIREFETYRLPLWTRTEVEPYLYAANGARIGANPGDDPSVVRHAIEVDFKTNITKTHARGLSAAMGERLQVVGYQGTITLQTDPHEAGSSRFDIRPGDNVHVIGHHGGVTVQVSEVSASGLQVTLTVDSLARDAEIVASMLDRDEEARRDLAARTVTRDSSRFNSARTVPYESESKAGRIARTAINGNSGLWTIRKAFVSQVGVAKIEFFTSPRAEFVVALFNRPVTANRIAALVPDPLADSDGWYDNVDTLKASYGCMEVFGTPSNSGGFWPRQEGEGPLTGVHKDSASTLYDSPYGGFVWVAMFTSVSAWIEGTCYPAVPT
jgi:hypothetical protein